MKAKKPAAPKADPTKDPEKKPEVTASSTPEISPVMLSTVRQSRQVQIDALLSNPAGPLITPATAKSLQEQYLSDEGLKLAFSSEDDGFDKMINILKQNQPQVELDQKSGPQVNEVLKLSNADIEDPEKNPVLASAEARAESAKAQGFAVGYES